MEKLGEIHGVLCTTLCIVYLQNFTISQINLNVRWGETLTTVRKLLISTFFLLVHLVNVFLVFFRPTNSIATDPGATAGAGRRPRAGGALPQPALPTGLPAPAHRLQPAPGHWAGEGVPVQQLCPGGPAGPAGQTTGAERAADQDLVPEPPNEAETRGEGRKTQF